MAWRTLNLRLKFYPVHIDYKKHFFRIGVPVEYDPEVSLKEQEQRLLEGIAAGI